MFVYFYHRRNLGHYDRKYPLTNLELKILKKFLLKKLIQDKRKFKILNIDSLSQESYIGFMLENPPIYRRNIIKCKLFKKLVKMLRASIPDFNTRYLPACNDLNLQIFREFEPKQAYNQMTNTFFLTCFTNSVFRADLVQLLKNDEVFKRIIVESKRKFSLKVEKWITIFSKCLCGDNALNECELMLKVRLNSSSDEIYEARSCFIEMVARFENRATVPSQ